MSDDLDDRLRRTLAEDADHASVPPGLATRARAEGDRRTHRLRGWLIGAAAALIAAVAIVIKHGKASISLVQRHLRIGYNRAARLLEAMERTGVVSHMNDFGQRTVLKGGAA